MHFYFHPGVKKLPFLVVVEEMTVQGQQDLRLGPDSEGPLPFRSALPRPPLGPSQATHTKLFSTTSPALIPTEPESSPTSLLHTEHAGVAMHELRRENPEPDSILASTYIF